MDRSGRTGAHTRRDRPHAHVLDLADRAMPGLAQSLAQVGMSVSGVGGFASEASAHLRRSGVTVHAAPVARWFPSETCLLVHGPSVTREHPARLGALRRGIAQTTPAGWMQRSMRGRTGIAVAGGREATTAVAMIGWALTRAGLDPTVLLGQRSPQLGGWSRTGRGDPVVVEFTDGPEALDAIAPRHVVLLRVGPDPWLETRSWRAAIANYRGDGPSDEARSILAFGHPSLIGGEPSGNRGSRPSEPFAWLSFQPGGDWWAADVRETASACRFRAFHRGRFVTEVVLRVPGRRNALSALAAVAVCERLDLPVASIREAIEEFSGLSRDFEVRGSYRGVTLVDDAAEEAGSIHQAVALARRTFGRRRLWVVHSAPSHPSAHQWRRLEAALADADRVVVIPGEESGPRSGWPRPALSLGAAGVPIRVMDDVAEVVTELDRSLEPGDVLLTLGAGDVGTIADAFIRRLSRDRQGG